MSTHVVQRFPSEITSQFKPWYNFFKVYNTNNIRLHVSAAIVKCQLLKFTQKIANAPTKH